MLMRPPMRSTRSRMPFDSIVLRALGFSRSGVKPASIVADGAVELIAGVDQLDLDASRMPVQCPVVDRLSYHHQ